MVEKELAAIENDFSLFEPSSTLDSVAYHIIQESNRLKALLEVDE